MQTCATPYAHNEHGIRAETTSKNGSDPTSTSENDEDFTKTTQPHWSITAQCDGFAAYDVALDVEHLERFQATWVEMKVLKKKEFF